MVGFTGRVPILSPGIADSSKITRKPPIIIAFLPHELYISVMAKLNWYRKPHINSLMLAVAQDSCGDMADGVMKNNPIYIAQALILCGNALRQSQFLTPLQKKKFNNFIRAVESDNEITYERLNSVLNQIQKLQISLTHKVGGPVRNTAGNKVHGDTAPKGRGDAAPKSEQTPPWRNSSILKNRKRV